MLFTDGISADNLALSGVLNLCFHRVPNFYVDRVVPCSVSLESLENRESTSLDGGATEPACRSRNEERKICFKKEARLKNDYNKFKKKEIFLG